MSLHPSEPPVVGFKSSLGYLKDTGTAKGIGVFASREIAEGEVVEVALVILLEGRFSELPPQLKHSVFSWSALGGPSRHAICLGYGGIYNHANPANLEYAMAGERAMKFTAARAIRADEELTVNYNHTNGGAVSDRDVWFEGKGLKPIP